MIIVTDSNDNKKIDYVKLLLLQEKIQRHLLYIFINGFINGYYIR